MSLVMDIAQRTEQMPVIRFERTPVEDVAASNREGRYVAKDTDFVLITPPYSKDVIKSKVSQWLSDLSRQVADGRVTAEWTDRCKEAYDRWSKGQDIPLYGTPIRGWAVISPAQQEMLCHLDILTVESLAGMNAEGRQRVGMGALELQRKAEAWLSQAQDKGKVTQELAAMKAENDLLKKNLESLEEQVRALAKAAAAPPAIVQERPTVAPTGILVTDILDEEPAPTKKR